MASTRGWDEGEGGREEEQGVESRGRAAPWVGQPEEGWNPDLAVQILTPKPRLHSPDSRQAQELSNSRGWAGLSPPPISLPPSVLPETKVCFYLSCDL